MAKDYYLILGVGPDATPDQIKSACRREAKRLHPDHSGEGCAPFQAVQEAYEVLVDPGRRRAYDEEMARRKKRALHAARQVRPEPLRPRRCPVEPLVPTQRPGDPRNIFSELRFASLFEGFSRSPWRDLDAPIWPTAWRGAEDIHLEVPLSREQAFHGGRIRI